MNKHDSDKMNWKDERIESLNSTLELFGNSKKHEREKWVVARLLEQFITGFEEKHLETAEEPADVKFQTANFQVKEILQPDRKRSDEYKESLKVAINANAYSELVVGYAPKHITLVEVVNDCVKYSQELCNKYGPHERKSLDLICYHNFLDTYEKGSEFNPAESFVFRSLSVVSNQSRVVVYAQENAPEFLQKQVGIVRSVNPEVPVIKKIK